MGWTGFLAAYLLGGITFLPLLVAIVFAHAYFTLPLRPDVGGDAGPAPDDLIQPGDDVDALKAAQKEKDAKTKAVHHETDVAAGYFAVCREYTPMGINAKPIERSTPVGSATVASPSPSVYQTMYRSFFDRKSAPSPIDNHNAANQRPRKAGNVFYVVLRHGHLMLFDDDEQLEVRHVVSLAHHDVSIYSGEAIIPEGELFIKRNAICLSRKTDGHELGPDSQLSKPFYLFSENCSAKEDFYFALLRNQEQSFVPDKRAPSPIHFDVKNIISLVQKLHSSEEHMQTRWLNAMIGRIFLGIHRTKDVENFIREKLTKKIARVKRPAFLSHIAIKGIDTGDSAPYITNPRLKDLTVEGECGIEADVRYTGNFRLEVAATARIDLGARFKAREVNLVLAVVLRKLEGHMLIKVKPPPSNRLWVSFQQAPKMEMTIEPIVSSRQITYNVILRQIESRIKEVIAETLVLPFWDDTPFFNTEHKKWRGGIFHDDTVQSSIDVETILAQEGEMDEVERLEDNQAIQEHDLPSIEKSHSVPVIENKPSLGLFGRRMSNKSKTDSIPSPSTSTTSIDLKSDKNDLQPDAIPSRPIPATTFVQPPTAIVGTDATNADIFKPSSSPPNESPAASAIATLSAKTQTPSSTQTPVASPFKPYVTSKSSRSSNSSQEVIETPTDVDTTPQARRNTASSSGSHEDSGTRSPSLASTMGSVKSQTGSITRGFFGRRDTTSSTIPSSPAGSDTQKRTALAAVSNVAASAKQWGLSALQRHANKNAIMRDGLGSHSEPRDLSQPMGRGQPLPPPGTPLPMPDGTAPIPVPRRKPVAPPTLENHGKTTEHRPERRHPVPPPPLPKRTRQIQSEQTTSDDNMLVVAAPADSEPTTPRSGTQSPAYMQPFVEDAEEMHQPTILPSNGDAQDAKPSDQKGQTSTGLAAQPAVGDVNKAQTEELTVDDDDYSAWMDNDEPEESTLDANTLKAQS